MPRRGRSSAGSCQRARVRDHLARQLGVSPGNDFSLLAAVGGDCAGAVRIVAEGVDAPADDRHEVRWLSEADLGTLISELPQRPLGTDAAGDVRLSLAGAHDKVPVHVSADGRIGLPLKGTPSTHIIKAPIPQISDSIVNEAFCLGLARELGIHAVAAEPRTAADIDYLLVTRYDRREIDGRTIRVHQEDMVQALGRPSETKYEAEGGPGLIDCIELLRRTSRRPGSDVLRFLDALTVNVLVGNADAHGKNVSILLDDDGPRLAPLYDSLCTVCYSGLSRRLAMGIGGEDRIEYVAERHWERFATAAGLGAAAARRRRRRIAERAPEAATRVAERLRAEGWDRPIVDRAIARVRLMSGRMAG